MSASQYRGDLARKRKQRVDAEKKASDFRIKEAAKRADATKARTAAAKSTSASTKSMKTREADRREGEANAASKEVGAWQKKAADYGKQEATIQEKLSRAEQSEALAAEKKRAADQRRTEASARAFQSETGNRLDHHQEQLNLVVGTIRAPKPERLRILMLSASGEGDLRVNRESKRIREAIRNANGRDLVELDVRTAATADDLLSGLTGLRPHVVHFSGHSDENFIVFEEDVDDFNAGVEISADAFAAAVGAVDEPPLLVVFNSCNSAPQAERLVKSIVPFAIGMSEEIDDGDAIAYAARFYASIADGQSIAGADAVARAALQMAGLPGSELPTLAAAEGSDPDATWLVVLPD
jgi:hypothetical protein